MKSFRPIDASADAQGLSPVAGESNLDYRARIALRHAEVQRQRQQELIEQNSVDNTPTVRIRIWERVHQVALPRDPAHKILKVIADNTGLSLEVVRAEQRQRTIRPDKSAM
ncbi:MAG TPA: hypothetical protein VME42_02850 [Steroidobacteraceae bacterium]|nr:hypothetical protein [Steroidobacteraceae bacterium]